MGLGLGGSVRPSFPSTGGVKRRPLRRGASLWDDLQRSLRRGENQPLIASTRFFSVMARHSQMGRPTVRPRLVKAARGRSHGCIVPTGRKNKSTHRCAFQRAERVSRTAGPDRPGSFPAGPGVREALRQIEPGFLIWFFGRPENVHFGGVWAAPGGQETFQKDGGGEPPYFWKVSRPLGAARQPKTRRSPVGRKIIY